MGPVRNGLALGRVRSAHRHGRAALILALPGSGGPSARHSGHPPQHLLTSHHAEGAGEVVEVAIREDAESDVFFGFDDGVQGD